MNKNLTEMVFILDRSGSMASLVSDTIGGYNSLLEKQRQEEGEAAVTTVLFDDKYDVVCDNIDIRKAKPMTDKVYYARGMTALLDAIGKTVNTVAARQQNAVESAVPAKTVVVIMTDGLENASKEYQYSDIKALIERQQKEFGWEFLFMGANIDAIGVAGKMGISASRAANYHADNIGTKKNFSAVNAAFSAVRSAGVMPDHWKQDIDKDYNSRKKN
ncbi:MAG: VWA domain-containing protein [Clostridia bacterium]|nr:VWA domain-containing protein [Clostridia bacterium]